MQSNEKNLAPEVQKEIQLMRTERKIIKDDLTNKWQGMKEEQLQFLYEEIQDLNDYIHRLLTGTIPAKQLQ